ALLHSPRAHVDLRRSTPADELRPPAEVDLDIIDVDTRAARQVNEFLFRPLPKRVDVRNQKIRHPLDRVGPQANGRATRFVTAVEMRHDASQYVQGATGCLHLSS